LQQVRFKPISYESTVTKGTNLRLVNTVRRDEHVSISSANW